MSPKEVIGGVYFITISLSNKLWFFNFLSIFCTKEKSFFNILTEKNLQKRKCHKSHKKSHKKANIYISKKLKWNLTAKKLKDKIITGPSKITKTKSNI